MSSIAAGRRLHALVTGRVQGVSFRWSMREQAERLGLAGWVRNRRDGSVEVEVLGPEEAVTDARRWLDRGPPGARVDAVEVVADEAVAPGGRARDGFEIRPTV